MLALHALVTLAALALIAVVLWEGFETVVLPRRIPRRLRLTRGYFLVSWRAWTGVARRLRSSGRREGGLSFYGPLALIFLLVFWAVLLIVGYALLQWGLGSQLHTSGGPVSFGTDLYFSGTTFLTLGLGDVFPLSRGARLAAVAEVGTGFGVLALVIGYFPVLYQAFSRREMRISLLDAHAGSPPTAGALLRRHPPARRAKALVAILAEWERWAADLLESHLSYPALAYYRSQHEDQSWVAALTMILDSCALTLTCGRGADLDEELVEQAAYTFAIARHAAIDLAQVFGTPVRLGVDAARLPPDDRLRLYALLVEVGGARVKAVDGATGGAAGGADSGRELDALRALYEPYVAGLAGYLLMPLPPWVPAPGALDDWQTTAEGVTAPSIAALVARRAPGAAGEGG
jgi:hypothetical protein